MNEVSALNRVDFGASLLADFEFVSAKIAERTLVIGLNLLGGVI